MLEVLFDIPTLKKLYPELNRCFGFTYDDISNELTQVYAQKVFNLTQEEKELANQCKSDDGWGVDAVKFALATNENIAVAVPDSFNPATIMESYAAKLHNEESASCALLFMAALLYRGKITEAPISEGENEFEYVSDFESERPQRSILLFGYSAFFRTVLFSDSIWCASFGFCKNKSCRMRQDSTI